MVFRSALYDEESAGTHHDHLHRGQDKSENAPPTGLRIGVAISLFILASVYMMVVRVCTHFNEGHEGHEGDEVREGQEVSLALQRTPPYRCSAPISLAMKNSVLLSSSKALVLCLGGY